MVDLGKSVVPDMAYNVFSGTLNPTQSISRLSHWWWEWLVWLDALPEVIQGSQSPDLILSLSSNWLLRECIALLSLQWLCVASSTCHIQVIKKDDTWLGLITFRVSHRPHKTYSGHACLYVCNCMSTLLHGPRCNLGEWYRMPPSCAVLGFPTSCLCRHVGAPTGWYPVIIVIVLQSVYPDIVAGNSPHYVGFWVWETQTPNPRYCWRISFHSVWDSWCPVV